MDGLLISFRYDNNHFFIEVIFIFEHFQYVSVFQFVFSDLIPPVRMFIMLFIEGCDVGCEENIIVLVHASFFIWISPTQYRRFSIHWILQTIFSMLTWF